MDIFYGGINFEASVHAQNKRSSLSSLENIRSI